MDASKPVRLSAHAKLRLPQRGASEEEVLQALRDGDWQPMADGKIETRLEFAGSVEWNGLTYRSRVVRPIFVELGSEIVVVTVFVYFVA
jgi:hypothetical protein